MGQTSDYRKAILAFMTVLIISLMILDTVIFLWERDVLYEDNVKDVENELSLIATFVTEPLLRHHFGEVEQVLVHWGEKKESVVRLSAYTPDGVLLTEYRRPQPSESVMSIMQTVDYEGRHLLDLQIDKDVTSIQKHLQHFQQQLLFHSLLITFLIGFLLWFVLKVLALRPLEKEVELRKRAEENLQQAHDQLEVRVAERTAELAETNISLGKEVAERVKAAEELRQSQTTLETVFDNSIPLSITSVDYNLLMANEEYYKVWPPQKGGNGPVKCYESRPGAYCHTPKCPLTQIVGGKEEVIFETTKDNGSGKRDEFIITARPYRDADGKLIGIVESFQDISDRKLAEAALQQSEERYRGLVDNLEIGVSLLSPDMEILAVNNQMKKWFPHIEINEKPICYKVFNKPPQKEICSYCPVVKTIKDGVSHETIKEAEVDGDTRYYRITSSPIKNAQGLVTGVIEMIEDITNRHKLEEELRQAKKIESIGVLAGGIAHDFNNLLTGILGNISIAKMKVAPEGGAGDALQKAENATVRATDLTQQLLTFSKGGSPITKPTSIVEIVSESVQFNLRGANVSCNFHWPENPWPVEVDEGQISQVVQNLVTNAIQAMPDGGMLDVRLDDVIITDQNTVPPAGTYVLLSIKDQGSGIPKSIQDKIFDPFYTTKKEGSGLGLAICYSIIKKHNGFITLESEEGVGSCFHIYFPATEQPLAEREESSEILSFGQGRILIMDDDSLVGSVAVEMLRMLGYEAELTNDGKEAIAAFQKAEAEGKPYGVVILDLTIPGGMGGKETMAQLREIAPDVKGIVSSGYSNDPVMAEYEKYGFSGVVTKPYRVESLSQAISELIGN